MESIFGAAWDALAPEDVERFLADAGDEGLTWEAKGTERPHPRSVQKHVCAFANAIGGFYIVGASRATGRESWTIDPVDFRGEEPATWLSKVIRNGLRPVPRYDVRSWSRDGKDVAVVNVDVVAEPPCMTTSGEVFVRVSGESHPVEDPATLRRLIEQGETRAAGAQREALYATEPIVPYAFPAPYMQVRLAFAPTGRAPDIAGRLFTKSFEKRLITAIDGLPSAPLFGYSARQQFEIEPSREALTVSDMTETGRERWTVRAAWDGSIAVYLDVIPKKEHGPRVQATAVFTDAVRPAADIASELVQELGGHGRMHVVLRVFGREFELGGVGGDLGDLPEPPQLFLPEDYGTDAIRTWTDSDGHLSDERLDRMRRELVRACGIRRWEPEPEEDET